MVCFFSVNVGGKIAVSQSEFRWRGCVLNGIITPFTSSHFLSKHLMKVQRNLTKLNPVQNQKPVQNRQQTFEVLFTSFHAFLTCVIILIFSSQPSVPNMRTTWSKTYDYLRNWVWNDHMSEFKHDNYMIFIW